MGVNLQNARKIADFPYPFPLAQVSMVLQLLHWTMTPLASAFALPRAWSVILSFFTIFVLWCIHFNALDLEFPFGDRVNDLPMDSFQKEWNKSILTLLDTRGSRPPAFKYDPAVHDELEVVMSDASELYAPIVPQKVDKGNSIIKIVTGRGRQKTSTGRRQSDENKRRSSEGGRHRPEGVRRSSSLHSAQPDLAPLGSVPTPTESVPTLELQDS